MLFVEELFRQSLSHILVSEPRFYVFQISRRLEVDRGGYLRLALLVVQLYFLVL